jgi:hypothetical protein
MSERRPKTKRISEPAAKYFKDIEVREITVDPVRFEDLSVQDYIEYQKFQQDSEAKEYLKTQIVRMSWGSFLVLVVLIAVTTAFKALNINTLESAAYIASAATTAVFPLFAILLKHYFKN